MASDMFLKLDGVDGELKDKDHKGWIDIFSFSLGLEQLGRRTLRRRFGRRKGVDQRYQHQQAGR